MIENTLGLIIGIGIIAVVVASIYKDDEYE